MGLNEQDQGVIVEQGLSRRGFLRRLWLGLGGLAFLELLWIAGDMLRSRRLSFSDNQTIIFTAGPVHQFAQPSVTAFPEGKFYLVRLAEGGFLALNRRCTHLGCTVPWIDQDQHFACPCHASVFDITGQVLGPPATRPLDLHPVRIENQIVKVDLSRLIKRTTFESGQVTST